MDAREKPRKVRRVKFRIPRTCICPNCGKKQKFRKHKEYWKRVKDMNVDEAVLLEVRVIYARCSNPNCPTRCFCLPTPGIKKRARSTDRLRAEAVASLVQDNSTCPRASRRLSRCFNTTGSKSSIDRWKHQEADKYDIAEIIQKLDFSGMLCVDEYKPSRAKVYDLIDSDAKTGRILYVAPIDYLGRGFIKEHFLKLKSLGINPQVVIFDMRKVFPNAARKAFPGVLIQHDYFHVMKTIHWHLRNAMAEFRKKLKEKGFYTQDLWECRWIILKNLENWTSEDHKTMQRLLNIYSGTVIEDILVIKEQIRDIFLKSQNKKEAYLRRDELCNNEILKQNEHFANIFKFLSTPYFEYMVKFLDYPEVPRSGNSENVIRVWRQMEKVRYGFKTVKGRLDHLKLYQISNYLKGEFG